MKILLTGANGQLGYEIIRLNNSFDLIYLNRSELDITDLNQVEKKFAEIKPDLVINAAAYTAVDKAESDQKSAFAVNRDGSANLARCCAEYKIPLIHVSTDFLFDGKKRTPYVETDPVAPLCVYGQSKADGEQAIVSVLKEHIIIRTSWLYGFHGNNFVKTMLKLGKEREVIRVVADQYGSPTSAEDLAEAILIIASQLESPATCNLQPHIWGIYHYSGSGITTWHGFAEKIFEIVKQLGESKIPRIEAITTLEYPTPAKRPAYSVLDCTLIQKNFGIIPKSWQESLKKIISKLLLS